MIRRFAIVVATIGIVSMALAPLTYATGVVDCDGLPADQCKLVSENKLDYKSNDNIVWNVVQFLFIALGGIAVIMIIVGGIQYTTSQGESGAVQKAKNTIMYSVIGLVVALAANGVVAYIANTVTN
jgi:hypothetical protein